MPATTIRKTTEKTSQKASEVSAAVEFKRSEQNASCTIKTSGAASGGSTGKLTATIKRSKQSHKEVTTNSKQQQVQQKVVSQADQKAVQQADQKVVSEQRKVEQQVVGANQTTKTTTKTVTKSSKMETQQQEVNNQSENAQDTKSETQTDEKVTPIPVIFENVPGVADTPKSVAIPVKAPPEVKSQQPVAIPVALKIAVDDSKIVKNNQHKTESIPVIIVDDPQGEKKPVTPPINTESGIVPVQPAPAVDPTVPVEIKCPETGQTHLKVHVNPPVPKPSPGPVDIPVTIKDQSQDNNIPEAAQPAQPTQPPAQPVEQPKPVQQVAKPVKKPEPNSEEEEEEEEDDDEPVVPIRGQKGGFKLLVGPGQENKGQQEMRQEGSVSSTTTEKVTTTEQTKTVVQSSQQAPGVVEQALQQATTVVEAVGQPQAPQPSEPPVPPAPQYEQKKQQQQIKQQLHSELKEKHLHQLQNELQQQSHHEHTQQLREKTQQTHRVVLNQEQTEQIIQKQQRQTPRRVQPPAPAPGPAVARKTDQRQQPLQPQTPQQPQQLQQRPQPQAPAPSGPAPAAAPIYRPEQTQDQPPPKEKAPPFRPTEWAPEQQEARFRSPSGTRSTYQPGQLEAAWPPPEEDTRYRRSTSLLSKHRLIKENAWIQHESVTKGQVKRGAPWARMVQNRDGDWPPPDQQQQFSQTTTTHTTRHVSRQWPPPEHQVQPQMRYEVEGPRPMDVDQRQWPPPEPPRDTYDRDLYVQTGIDAQQATQMHYQQAQFMQAQSRPQDLPVGPESHSPQEFRPIRPAQAPEQYQRPVSPNPLSPGQARIHDPVQGFQPSVKRVWQPEPSEATQTSNQSQVIHQQQTRHTKTTQRQYVQQQEYQQNIGDPDSGGEPIDRAYIVHSPGGLQQHGPVHAEPRNAGQPQTLQAEQNFVPSWRKVELHQEQQQTHSQGAPAPPPPPPKPKPAAPQSFAPKSAAPQSLGQFIQSSLGSKQRSESPAQATQQINQSSQSTQHINQSQQSNQQFNQSSQSNQQFSQLQQSNQQFNQSSHGSHQISQSSQFVSQKLSQAQAAEPQRQFAQFDQVLPPRQQAEVVDHFEPTEAQVWNQKGQFAPGRSLGPGQIQHYSERAHLEQHGSSQGGPNQVQQYTEVHDLPGGLQQRTTVKNASGQHQYVDPSSGAQYTQHFEMKQQRTVFQPSSQNQRWPPPQQF